MGYIGKQPTKVPLTSEDIVDESIESADIKEGTIVNSDINAAAGIVTSKVTGAVTSITSHGLATSATTDTTNADNIGSGTLPDARLPATLPAKSGVNLTAFNASEITSGTLPDARLPATLPAKSGVNLTALNATELTSGTVPPTRMGSGTANSTTVLYGDGTYKAEPVTNLTAIRQDIAMLALYNAVSDNRAAYNLPFSFIDQFEDDTGVTTQTTVDNVDEYFASVYAGGQTLISGGTGTIIGTQLSSGLWDGSNTTGQTSGAGSNDWAGKDWGSGNTKTVTGFRAWNNENTYGFNVGGANVEIKLQGSTDSFSSSVVDLGTTGSVADGQGAAYPFKIEKLTGITTTTAYRYHRLYFNNTTDIRWSELELYDNPSTVNATGTLISDQQTAPALTKMSGVVLVKDGGSSTTVMGTHLKIYFCATGAAASFPSAWVEADSYTAVTALFSTGVTMYKLGETTVPSGTLPTIRAVWASQTSGGFESQLHGWAMNY